eukprot:GEZU01024857.1.p1 GENE.GEZU01024857.1~~GEZU01024857.1.p1  ORF type:complete len:247 (+),score=21.16 GEZU01024857.1:45-785(+)
MRISTITTTTIMTTIQYEAAWALTNIASGATEHVQYLIRIGAVPPFVHYVGTAANVEMRLREQCVWALGNIAGDSADARNYVLALGAIDALKRLLVMPKLSTTILRNVAWTVSNLCRGKPVVDIQYVPQLLEILRQYIYHNDTEMLSDASWGISYLSDATNDRVDLVVQSGVCRRMVELLLYHDDTVVAPALRTVGNILTGNYEQTQTIINVGGLQCLRHLLAHPKKSIRKETPLPMPRLAEQPTK